MTTAVPAASRPAWRWVVPIVVVGSWLAFIAVRQLPLFPPVATLPAELVPAAVVLAVIVVAAALRVARPTIGSHVAFLAAATCGLALLAAQVGQPLANATTDYCGDQCRSAIMARFVAFFGWPIVAAAGLAILARVDARSGSAGSAERAAWTRAWAAITLVLGLVAAVSWWRTILPNG